MLGAEAWDFSIMYYYSITSYVVFNITLFGINSIIYQSYFIMLYFIIIILYQFINHTLSYIQCLAKSLNTAEEFENVSKFQPPFRIAS